DLGHEAEQHLLTHQRQSPFGGLTCPLQQQVVSAADRLDLAHQLGCWTAAPGKAFREGVVLGKLKEPRVANSGSVWQLEVSHAEVDRPPHRLLRQAIEDISGEL